MPCSTYMNLSKDKQDLIFHASLEEFSKYTYKEASVTRVVEKLNIAKGSMYRYFKSKKELYYYLIERASNTKLNYISENINLNNEDFLSVLKEVLIVGTKFDIEYPKYSIFISKVFSGNNDPFKNETVESLKRKSEEFLMNVVEQGMIKGDVRRDVDKGVMSFFLGEIINNIGKYVFNRFDLGKDDFVQNLKTDYMKEQIDVLYDDLIKLIKEGIGN